MTFEEGAYIKISGGGDAGANDYRGATLSSSNEKLFVAMRVND